MIEPPDKFNYDARQRHNYMHYSDAIMQNYCRHEEFEFERSLYNFRAYDTNQVERGIIRKTILAIAQVELKLETFWSGLSERIPNYGAVEASFRNSESRHVNIYRQLLDVFDIEDSFKQLSEVPAIQARNDYLEDCIKGVDSLEEENYTKSVLLFSTFVENVSQCCQFLIIKSFGEYNLRRVLHQLGDLVKRTSRDRRIRGLFGQELAQKSQTPKIMPGGFKKDIQRVCRDSYNAEMDILDWIFSEGELDILPRKYVDEFLKQRFNQSLKRITINPIFETNDDLLGETRWFDKIYDDLF
jgi:ribonucleoside-diphosphate reductase beta chain